MRIIGNRGPMERYCCVGELVDHYRNVDRPGLSVSDAFASVGRTIASNIVVRNEHLQIRRTNVSARSYIVWVS